MHKNLLLGINIFSRFSLLTVIVFYVKKFCSNKITNMVYIYKGRNILKSYCNSRELTVAAQIQKFYILENCLKSILGELKVAQLFQK